MLRHWAAQQRALKWLAGIAVVILALVIVWALFVPLADWFARHDVGSVTGSLHETALDNARGRLLTLGAGLLAAGALLFTARSFSLSREGQVTDRYTKAIEQLGSDKLDVRIGGIYALERVARDSARDHPTVMEVLAAFIREHSREQWPTQIQIPEPVTDAPPWRTTRPDVQAAVTVIGRRNITNDLGRINLTSANLTFADLDAGNLPRVDLKDADLTYANLMSVYASLADLSGANLTGARLREADLRRTDLSGANLRDADLTGARWPEDAPVPEGWERDTSSDRLKRANAGSGPAEAD